MATNKKRWMIEIVSVGNGIHCLTVSHPKKQQRTAPVVPLLVNEMAIKSRHILREGNVMRTFTCSVYGQLFGVQGRQVEVVKRTGLKRALTLFAECVESGKYASVYLYNENIANSDNPLGLFAAYFYADKNPPAR